MPTEIIINALPEEVRVALLDNREVVEIYIDRRNEGSIVGNVYKGKVVKILPGMQAAFVDIGLDRAAFLYVSDAGADAEEYARMIEEEGRERSRLRELVQSIRKPGMGYIIRTASEDMDIESLTADAEFLELLWQNIQQQRDTVSAPALLYSELDLIFRTIRDL